jgi:hypothetical protein
LVTTRLTFTFKFEVYFRVRAFGLRGVRVAAVMVVVAMRKLDAKLSVFVFVFVFVVVVVVMITLLFN